MGHHFRSARPVLVPAALAIVLMSTAASAQELCVTYTVKPGDTLSQIAKKAGVPNGFQGVYAANRDAIANPNIIEVGMKLKMPCPEGSAPPVAATAEPVAEPAAEPAVEPVAAPVVEAPVVEAPVVAAPAEKVAAAPEPAAPEAAPAEPLPPIRFLTGANYAPFVDEKLPEGGMFTELVKVAMGRAAPDLAYRVSYINDWGSHLTELLPVGAFDAGFPWYLPDCAKVDRLGEGTKARCTEFDASDPFFEAAVGYYTKAGNPLLNATSYTDLMGKRLCRPDGWFMFDLEAEGLVEPNVTMMIAPTQVDCWRALEADQVDVVTFDALPAEADIATLKISDNVKEIMPLASVQTLHVFIPKSNRNGKAYLEILNRGLAEIRADGTWFNVVSARMREHEAMNATDN